MLLLRNSLFLSLRSLSLFYLLTPHLSFSIYSSFFISPLSPFLSLSLSLSLFLSLPL